MNHTPHTIPLGSYLKAATRTAAKHRLDMCCHPNGEPILHLADNFVRFWVCDREGNNYYMSIAVGRWVAAPIDVAGRIKTTSMIDGFATAHLLPLSAEVCDPCENIIAHDILLQERNTPLANFISSQIAQGRVDRLRCALQSILPLIRSMAIGGLTHGNINANTIEFTSQGHIRLLDYPTSLPHPSRPRKDDVTTLAYTATLLFVAACNPKAYRLLRQQVGDSANSYKRLRHILSAAEHHHLPALIKLVKHLLGDPDRHTLSLAIEALSVAPFNPMPLLSALLEQHAESHSVGTEFTPTQSELIDLSTCEQVLPASNLLVRFKRFDRWGYATPHGEVIHIERPLLAAFEFNCGRAVVRTAEGYGMIDEQGRWIIDDCYDDVGWFGNEGVATVCDKEGRWHIHCGLSGRRLSSKAADWMGEASEGFVVARHKGLYGYYYADGRIASRFIYDQAHGFFGGSARVMCRGEWFYIDTSLCRLSARQAEEADKIRADR